MNAATCDRAAQLFAALSHPTRLRIVELLLDQGKTVNEIAEQLGIGQSGASQHLATLARSGVLVVEPRGVARIYRVRGPRVGQILTLIEAFCEVHNLYGTGSAAPDDRDTYEATRHMDALEAVGSKGSD